MPSKGIKCFAYMTVPNVEIEFSVPKQSITQRNLSTFAIDHLEVESSHLPRFKFTGQFKFVVRRDGRELTSQWVDVNSLTGSLENGTMKNMDQTPSILTDDVIISYGFYDAGPGMAGLPKMHQCYVTVIKNQEHWMRELAPPDSDLASRPFNKLVLPSAHDIGMNSLATSQALLKNAGTSLIKQVLGGSLPHALSVLNKVSDSAINRIAPDIIRALAITQKDSLDTILRLGARYFEFRPAKCHRQMQSVSPFEDTLYFQHGAIPGMAYKTFLSDIVRFLTDHAHEIVVVHNRWDGVPGDCPRPSQEDLHAVLADVLSEHNTPLVAGTQDDMLQLSIQQLRASNKRLLILHNASQLSNYDDTASATLDGAPIATKLAAMANSPGPQQQQHHAIALLQCQATATNIRDVIVASVLDSDVSTSPILATKPVCDARILPLLSTERTALRILEGQGVGVVMNDFFDGATADVAIGICRERLR